LLDHDTVDHWIRERDADLDYVGAGVDRRFHVARPVVGQPTHEVRHQRFSLGVAKVTKVRFESFHN
jgi:hypothetical protein